MMIDKLLELSDAQSVTADAASTNTIDFGSDVDMGVGSPLWIVFSVDVAADSTTGDETYILKVQTDDNDAFSSATDLISATILAAALPAGAQHVFALPYNNERFLRAYYDVGGTTPTITISAWLTSEMPRKWAAYPNAVGA